MTEPDWGHGPNTPVVMFTEQEIRMAWLRYRPDAAASGPTSLPDNTFDALEQFIEVLRQVRGT
jgi:hypothetical protein